MMYALLILSMWVGRASAAPFYNVTFCGTYATNFNDAYAGLGDDYLVDNLGVITRGARFQIDQGGAPVSAGFMNTFGCYGPINLDGAKTYTVRMFSEARVNIVGANYNTVEVMASEPANAQYAYLVRGPGWSPVASITINFTTPAAAQWNVAAAAGLALHLSQAGMINQHISLYVNDATPLCAGDCISSGLIFITNNQYKFIIAHQLGHLQQRWHNGGVGAYFDDTASPGNCYTSASTGAGHEMNSKEYQTMAAYEGFASFYSALAFNDRTAAGASCKMYYWNGAVDWDLTGVAPSAEVACNGAPAAGLAAADYLGTMCTAPIGGRGVEYDYVRFLWDMTTTRSIVPDDLLEVWDEAAPDAWTGATNVKMALENAAYTAPNFGADWATESANNGVDQ